MSAASYGWKVGVSVFVPYRIYRGDIELQEWAIEKVGRVWVHIARNGVIDKFDAETMHLHHGGYGSRCKVFASEAEYHESTEISQRWSGIYRVINGMRPKGITLDQVATIEAILGITPPPA